MEKNYGSVSRRFCQKRICVVPQGWQFLPEPFLVRQEAVDFEDVVWQQRKYFKDSLNYTDMLSIEEAETGTSSNLKSQRQVKSSLGARGGRSLPQVSQVCGCCETVLADTSQLYSVAVKKEFQPMKGKEFWTIILNEETTVLLRNSCCGTVDQLYYQHWMQGGLQKFAHLVHMYFVDSEKAFNCMPLGAQVKGHSENAILQSQLPLQVVCSIVMVSFKVAA